MYDATVYVDDIVDVLSSFTDKPTWVIREMTPDQIDDIVDSAFDSADGTYLLAEFAAAIIATAVRN